MNLEPASSAYERLQTRLRATPATWLITGVAGFIGSNLLETLLKLDQRVVGLDNFATGHRRNLDQVEALVSSAQWGRFHFVEGDIRDLATCRRAMIFPHPIAAGVDQARSSAAEIPVDYVLHQAALGSVPRSIEDPIATNQANIDGFLNMLVAARDAEAKRFVYASSSSIYGDYPDLPKREDRTGHPLSPYAVTKLVDERYADVFARNYGFETIGLRYFNIFGPRQDPNGAYAAVIPKWIAAMIRSEPVFINGDGETSRDFCYIANAVQTNLLAATSMHPEAANQAYNVALGDRTSLNQLFEHLRGSLAGRLPHLEALHPNFKDFRSGDVRHSQADIGKAAALLGYVPSHRVEQGLEEAMAWYVENLQ